MPISKDLFLAILSMDSYNRGYGRAIKFSIGESTADRNEVGARIGNASVLRDANDAEGVSQAAGFYAIAYDVSSVAGFTVDTKVVMYRGSDKIPGNAQSIWDCGATPQSGWRLFVLPRKLPNGMVSQKPTQSLAVNRLKY